MISEKAKKPQGGCFGKKKRKKNCPDQSKVEQRSVSGLNVTRVESLPNRLSRGRVLCVVASTTPNCQRWSVNLLCGNTPNSDIALHFNPRLLQHYVVRNSRLKGQWGQEEPLTSSGLRIRSGEEFHLKIYVADDRFFVTYNGRHVCDYAFRVPLNTITHLEVCGMVDLYKIEMEDFDSYPVDEDDLYVAEEAAGAATGDKKMVTPIRCLLPEGFQENWQIEIYGIPKILPQSFSISFIEENHFWPLCTIPLRLTANFGNNILVRNAFIDNKWGMEERAGGFKFLPFTPFSLWIRKSSKKFSIWINEKLQAEFGRRCAMQAKAVHIQGDVVISRICVNKEPEIYF